MYEMMVGMHISDIKQKTSHNLQNFHFPPEMQYASICYMQRYNLKVQIALGRYFFKQGYILALMVGVH